jgi:hypothetical protein
LAVVWSVGVIDFCLVVGATDFCFATTDEVANTHN